MADFFARTFFFPFDPQLKLPVVKGDGSGVEYGPEVVYFDEVRNSPPSSNDAPLLVTVDKAAAPVTPRRVGTLFFLVICVFSRSFSHQTS